MQSMDNNTFQIDYTIHDIVYKRNKEDGLPGWDNADETAKQVKLLTDLFNFSVVPQTGRVLDIGCGAGSISFWVESRGYQVTGIDVSPVAIEWAIEKARQTNSGVEFKIINAAQHQYKFKHKFDIVMDNNCLHCIIGKDRILYLDNIYKNLISGGVYISNTMCDDFRDENLTPFFDHNSRLLIRNNLAVRYIGRHEDILHELTKAGLRLLYHEVTSSDIQDTMSIIAVKV